jgi:hypothetical protein
MSLIPSPKYYLMCSIISMHPDTFQYLMDGVAVVVVVLTVVVVEVMFSRASKCGEKIHISCPTGSWVDSIYFASHTTQKF